MGAFMQSGNIIRKTKYYNYYVLFMTLACVKLDTAHSNTPNIIVQTKQDGVPLLCAFSSQFKFYHYYINVLLITDPQDRCSADTG